MADICGECLKLDWNNKEKYSSKDKYYCNEMRRYVEPTDRACRYYSYDKNHNQKDDGGFKQSGCSFSMIVRDILGFSDNCELLNLLRSFRENILKKNKQYIPILLEYDQISPMICEKIEEHDNKYRFSLEFLQNFLLPFGYAFKSNEIENALSIYQNMFGFLKSTFGFNDIQVNTAVEYNLETLGKGRIRQPKTCEI